MKNKVIIGFSVLLVVLIIAGIGIGIGKSRSDKKERITASESSRSGNKQEKSQKKDKEDKNSNSDESKDKSNHNEEKLDSADNHSEETNEKNVPAETNKAEESAGNQPAEPTPTPVPVAYPESEGARKAYLTFDDGSSPQTDRILDILAQYGVKATFFVTAQGGEENAARYRRIVAEGHSIGLHSVTHNYKQVYENLDTFIADVEGIRKFVLDTTGIDSHLYRFPGGSSNTVSNVPMDDCIRYLNQNGYRYFDWNVDTSDTVKRGQSVDELLSRVFGTVVDKYHNCVILMHDSAHQDITVAALPYIIEGLQARGLEILPITDATPVVQHKKADSVQ